MKNKNTIRILILVFSVILTVCAFLTVLRFGTLESVAGSEKLNIGIDSDTPDEPMKSAEGTVDLEGIKFLNTRYIRIIPGGNYRIEYETVPEDANEAVFWYSSNENVASVSEEGEVTAYREGDALLYAETSTRGIHKTVFVQVIPMPKSILDVPYINQCANYPNGCESISTVMALNFLGIDVEPDEFIDNYLDMADIPKVKSDGKLWAHSPYDYFLGDPRDSTGLCCFAPCITKALNKFVDTEKYDIKEMYNVPIEDLCRDYISNNVPVIFWGSMYMEAPYVTEWTWNIIDGKEGETFSWINGMHCLLLIGFDDDYYYFNDPVSGKGVAYTKEDTQYAYDMFGCQAVAVVPKVVSER